MTEPILEMTGIVKRYPGVTAVDGAQLTLMPGEVHCLVGENGAGKSTLMKVLAGAVRPDDGEIRLGGEAVRIESPQHAQRLGISMIYQEFNLTPYQSVAENIFLGREPRYGWLPIVHWSKLYDDARSLLSRIRVNLDVHKLVCDCSIAEQQMVEIAKALAFNARVIVMDEPSATLTEHELDALFDLIRNLKTESIGIIYISHRLEEVFALGDRVTVMRDGAYIDTQLVSDTTREAIIKRMVGRELTEEFPKQTFERGEERLRVDGLTRQGVFEDVSFSVYTGEIVGLTGLVGAGRSEVARAIFGTDPIDSGQILLDGNPVRVRSPREAIGHGIGLLTEDRKNQGLVLGMSVRENTTLANLKALVRGGLLRQSAERESTNHYVEDLRIKTPSIDQAAQNLSGGNQQKVVLAKWLFTHSTMLIFDEPTRGVDVGAKVEIYRLMNDLVRRGVGVLIISSELPEVLGMCDRILVMHAGRIAGELERDNATQERVMQLATGDFLTKV